MTYRNLEQNEILELERNGCTAQDWKNVKVGDSFRSDRVRRVHFQGQVSLGSLEGHIRLPSGENRPCGIFNARISRCVISKDVLISNVAELSGYHISKGVCILNVNRLSVNSETFFGNDTVLNIVNEGGGRELLIHDRLSAQEAWLQVFCKNSEKLNSVLRKLVRNYSNSVRSDSGLICENVLIMDSGSIRDVKINPYARIEGSLRLCNGTINSSKEDPVYVGAGVIAEDFILSEGTVLADSAQIKKCFVGQGVKIRKQFTGTDSAFFANSEFEQGEAQSLFAGPYSVSHHKSTLLIGCMTSFYNAGSGTNQSNHSYRLGPVHQGVIDRGTKTGSSSCLIWPSHIGPFSIVVGKHTRCFDSSLLPFSLIREKNGRSLCSPGSTLVKSGLWRDAVKWPDRDRRRSVDMPDLLQYDILSAYSVSRIRKSVALLKGFSGQENRIGGLIISQKDLEQGLEYYSKALQIYSGTMVSKKLGDLSRFEKWADIRKQLVYKGEPADAVWIDLAGIYVPSPVLEIIKSTVENGKYDHIHELQVVMKEVINMYPALEWNSCASQIIRDAFLKDGEWNAELLADLIRKWQSSTEIVFNQVREDALKDFSSAARIGYGLGAGNPETDFRAVRGDPEEDLFLDWTGRQVNSVSQRADEILNKLENLSNV